MRYLGIDYGTKRLGVAVSDPEGKLAFPHAVLLNDSKLTAAIGELVHEKNIETIIVGDARELSGAENRITPEVEKFAEELKTLGIPVNMEREAWSSQEARRYSGGSRAHDASEAAIILQRYLDKVQ